MSTFATLEAAREYMSGDRFAMDCGVTLEELTEDGAVCALTLGKEHLNANGGVMGGVIFTLADFAFACAANQIHRPTVAQQVSCSFLSAPKGTRLTARAVCRRSGRGSTVMHVDVSDDAGRDVAGFVCTGCKL